MMKPFASHLVLARIVACMILLGISACFAQNKVVDTLSLVEDTTPIFRNPGKGWVFYTTWFNGMTADQIARGSVCYSRFSWVDIEPQEGTFNWATIDNGIARCKAQGIKYAFGIMNISMDWGPDDGYATPKWVFDAGATYYRVKDIRRPTLYNTIPYWTNNPVFFTKMNAFIQAMGTRYNGNPDISWIDIRSYGNWGEGHLGGISKDMNGATITEPTSTAMTTDYYQPFLAAFPKTQLILPWGHAGHNVAYDWAVNNGIGMRRDGLPDWSDGTDIARADGKEPAVVEYTANYTDMVTSNVWNDSLVTTATLNAHASYAEISRGDPVQFMTAADSYMKNLANKIGYHFVLRSIALPWDNLIKGTSFPVRMKWVNRGTTNLYNENGFIALALLNASGQVVDSSWIANVDPKTWRPGNIDISSNVQFLKAPSGSYTLALGLFTSKANASPDYRLGNTGRNASGWYVLSSMTIKDAPTKIRGNTLQTQLQTNEVSKLRRFTLTGRTVQRVLK
jgi:hypothetical protein